MHPLDDPFAAALREVETFAGRTRIILVDFHAEATSEKIAMGWHLDGRVTAVIGTHTHVQTADERILPNGTAYITDAGMTGPHESIIGTERAAGARPLPDRPAVALRAGHRRPAPARRRHRRRRRDRARRPSITRARLPDGRPRADGRRNGDRIAAVPTDDLFDLPFETPSPRRARTATARRPRSEPARRVWTVTELTAAIRDRARDPLRRGLGRGRAVELPRSGTPATSTSRSRTPARRSRR